jgi:hypothetical protein
MGDLADHIPPGDLIARGIPCGVEALATSLDGRECLRLALDRDQRMGELGRDFGDEPTFLLLPESRDPVAIEAQVRVRLLPDAPDYARGFIGLAWNVQPDRFEAAYLRPTNGTSYAPPPPRDQRGVQYFAYPDAKFDRLRETAPGRYEAAADIRLDQWHHLRVTLDTGVRVEVDGTLVLSLDHRLLPARSGQVGLWVDIGTEGFFSGVTFH